MQDQRNNRRQIDDITGLFNMNHFLEDATVLLRDSEDGELAVIYFDIENFKAYNQTYGFHAGNTFLRQVAHIMRDTFPDGILARLHEDHFVAAIVNEDIVSRVLRVQERVQASAQQVDIRMKAGIYVSEGDAVDVTVVLDRAKLACESIKRLYDQSYCYFDTSMESGAKLRQYIVSRFESAMARGDLRVYYQPEVRVLTRQVCGFEALARWIDPVYGMISPGIFVEVLEEAHLSDKLDLFIVRQVCEDFAEVRAHAGDGWNLARISVNLSRVDFQLKDMFEAIEKIREETGTMREQLHIEVTESAIEDEMLQETIQRFRSAGYEVWMDDFGSRYSSLNNLIKYEFDVVKLDMQFMRMFKDNPKARTMIKGIIGLAKDLGIHTLVEGVETEEQYAFLRDIGCEMVQGYLFGRPAPLRDAAAFYAGEHATLSFEPFGEADYYRNLGMVNVLSTFPFLPPEERRDHISDVPLAIMEVRNGEISFLYSNGAFRSLLHSLGVPGMQELLYSLSHLDEQAAQVFWHLINEAVKTGEEQQIEQSVGGHIFTLRLKCVSCNMEKKLSAIALIADNLTPLGPVTALPLP
ncbi:putative bifunctional diguanylate cyclase/phosphodiesterase [Selenomonas sp. KH1T6]|uniref:putative bifunctional diguanylate cyclase/phosphodiesterase n=1 Tax=Selenomonas sp. KH1T6 TaxID=3158784 RepID=UPI0008A73C68|nr:diguanylate cyclase (GGDEF) domain-containing protein [Selenomonas ruminantium]